MRLILTLMTKNKTVMQKKVNIFPILQFLEHCISVLDTSIQQNLSREWGFTPAKANKRLVLFAAAVSVRMRKAMPSLIKDGLY